jgi:hypothetical protein
MDIKERYEELYENMATSKDVEKMLIFGGADKWAFNEVVVLNPSLAQRWVEKLEAICWKNYVTENEAKYIVSRFKWQDGRNDAKWSMPIFRQAVEAVGGKMEDKPYYNEWALWATANMIYSDSGKTLSEFISEEHMPKVVYMLAVDKLKDEDRPRFIRRYFGL